MKYVKLVGAIAGCLYLLEKVAKIDILGSVRG